MNLPDKIPQTQAEIDAAIVELKRQGYIPEVKVEAKLQLFEPEVQQAAARWIRSKAIATEVDVIFRIIGAIIAGVIFFLIAGIALIALLSSR